MEKKEEETTNKKVDRKEEDDDIKSTPMMKKRPLESSSSNQKEILNAPKKPCIEKRQKFAIELRQCRDISWHPQVDKTTRGNVTNQIFNVLKTNDTILALVANNIENEIFNETDSFEKYNCCQNYNTLASVLTRMATSKKNVDEKRDERKKKLFFLVEDDDNKELKKENST